MTTTRTLQPWKLHAIFTAWLLRVAVMCVAASIATPQAQAADGYRTVADITFAQIGDRKLLLDLYLPTKTAASKPPLVMFIHGGSWRAGTRKDSYPLFLAEHGYAVASIDYRLSQDAVFPAQILDCKAAVRWLRAHAGDYGYDTSQVVVMGSSAGGYLAVLLGTSGGELELEGDVGGNLDQSSRVQAIVDFYGPVDFILRSKDQPKLTDDPSGKVYQLLGQAVKKNEVLAKQASGAWHVTADDPPLLVIHGTADKTVLPNQSQRICDVYRSQGLKVEFHPVEGAAHGGPLFSTPECQRWVLDFLQRILKK